MRYDGLSVRTTLSLEMTEETLATYVYKVYEVHVLSVDHFRQHLVAWHAHLALAVGHNYRPVVVVKENFSSCGSCKDGSWWDALDLHHECHVVLLVLSREERLPNVQLVQYAAEGPHINACCVGDAEHNLRGTIETTLNVGVNLLVFEATRAKVDNFDA